jgi:hypothetical protein
MGTHAVMLSPLLSENPADIKQRAFDYVEARWGLRGDSTSSLNAWRRRIWPVHWIIAAL